jgi:hypothetical protein
MQSTVIEEAAYYYRLLRCRQYDLARFRVAGGTVGRSKEIRRALESAVLDALDKYWEAQKALKEWAYKEFIYDLAHDLVVIEAED